MEKKDFLDKRRQHFKKKADWHKLNAPIMAKMFDYKCQECTKVANLKTGVIHHNQYTGHDYEKPIEKLLSHNAIEWLCKKCHKKRHIAISRNEVDIRIKHSGFCALCQNFSWHAWFKIQLGIKPQYGNENFPICNTCLKYLIKKKLLVEYRVGDKTFNKKIVSWGELENLDSSEKELSKKLIGLIQRDSFGNINLLNENETKQGKLF